MKTQTLLQLVSNEPVGSNDDTDECCVMRVEHIFHRNSSAEYVRELDSNY